MVKRQITLNKHMTRYWLSVGAIPTPAAARLLNYFNFYPKYPIPFGSETTYEKPKRVHRPGPLHDHFKSMVDPDMFFRQQLQGYMNSIERRKGVAHEALSNLGEGNEEDLAGMKTDDINSEEFDIFERVKNFEELQQRF